MLQFLDNLRRLLNFLNYIGEIDQFTLNFLKRSSTWGWTFSLKFLIVEHMKETTINENLNAKL